MATQSVSPASSHAFDGAAADLGIRFGHVGNYTLPTAVGSTSSYQIKNVYTADITVATTSSQTIDGSTTLTVHPNMSVELISDGSNWQVF